MEMAGGEPPESDLTYGRIQPLGQKFNECIAKLPAAMALLQ